MTLTTHYRTVVQLVSEAYNVSVDDIMGRYRFPQIAEARMMAMALAWETHRHSSSTSVGEFFGRDHATVLHASKRTAALASAYPKTHQIYHYLKIRLREIAHENNERNRNSSAERPVATCAEAFNRGL